MEYRYFVYRKKPGNSRFTHTRKTFFNKEEALEEAKKYDDAFIEKINETGKVLETIIAL